MRRQNSWPRGVVPFLCSVLLIGLAPDAKAAPAGFNYDEEKVPPYVLPDVLKSLDGTLVKGRRTWTQKRRPEVLELFRAEVFGRIPKGVPKPTFELLETSDKAFDGNATRKQVRIWLLGTNGGPRMDLLLYTPNAVRGRAPVFIGLNFGGNHTTTEDPGVLLNTNWVGEKYAKTNKGAEAPRGLQSSRWQIEKVIGRGYAVATAYYGDIENDKVEGYATGIRGIVSGEKTNNAPGDSWGAISAWAWGLSRAMDYLQTDKSIDSAKVVLHGHSRLGKTALWAGAQDERFAAVISNNSGEGGAALARRNFGETTKRINTSFPHWFCGNYKKYNDNEAALPVDAHMLLALSAPRPIYVASAQEDVWADPKGEFLALKNAEPVYKLFDIKGIPSDEMPPVNQPVGSVIRYHIRTGVHDITEFDWEQYLDFADANLRKSSRR